MFEKQLPSKLILISDKFKEWKLHAFMEFIRLNRDPITNIIAIGDSQIEIDAANYFA